MPWKDPKPLPDLDAPTWAYIAGLLDGEGYFARGSSGVSLRVNMANKDVLEWLHSQVGGTLNFKAAAKAEWQDQWVWQLARQPRVNHALRHIRPYLRVKCRQADLMLEFLRAARFCDPGSAARHEAWEAMEGMNRATPRIGATFDPIR